MVLKSAKPTVLTLNPHSASARRGSVFAGVLVEIVTLDALLLASVELIQISLDSLHSCLQLRKTQMKTCTVLQAKCDSDSDVMFCLQSYQGLRIDISLVY